MPVVSESLNTRTAVTHGPLATHADQPLRSLSCNILFDSHRLVEGVHLLTFLAQRTQPAKHMDAEVAERRPVNLPSLSHLAADAASTEHADARAEEQKQSVHTARFADFLGNFTGRVARNEVGDDAQAAVVEAAAETVLKFTGHD